MKRNSMGIFVGACAMTFLGSGVTLRAVAQESSQDSPPAAPAAVPAHPADGRRNADLPAEAYAVVPGTRFLVRLEDELDTKETREKSKFKVRTLEPLEAGGGIYLPSGAEIRGHVSRVDAAHCGRGGERARGSQRENGNSPARRSH